MNSILYLNYLYYWFLPFVVLSGNCIYLGFSNHQIYIFLNFVSLLVLVALVLLVLRVLCLSLIFLLIYSGAVIITFIFVLMTFDQSDIHCIPSYKFIPVLVLYLEGFITMVAYEIGQHGLVLLLTLGRLLGENSRYISFNTIIIPM